MWDPLGSFTFKSKIQDRNAIAYVTYWDLKPVKYSCVFWIRIYTLMAINMLRPSVIYSKLCLSVTTFSIISQENLPYGNFYLVLETKFVISRGH